MRLPSPSSSAWRGFLAALLGLFCLTALRAQTVHWEPGESSTGSMIQLVFEDCEPDGDPQLPSIPGATLTFAGSSSSVNMVNFNVSRTLTLSYFVQAKRAGTPLQIPAFTLKTNKGPIKVAAYNGAAPAFSTDSVASSKLLPEKPSVWAGEVFTLTYELTAARRNNPQVNPGFEWNAAPLIAEDWSKYEVSESVVDGQRQAKLTYHTRAYAKNPTTVKLEPATHLLQVQTGSASFGLFSQPRMEPVSVTSDQPTIEVRPLPAPPTGFSGAVGEFKLTAKVVPAEATVGEPVTWTLELSGTGNWPDIAGLPARNVSKDFQVVQPKAKRTPADGKLFDATLAEDVVLLPTKAGTYTLGPTTFVFFNPRSGKYETIRTDAATVRIAPAAAPQVAPGAPKPENDSKTEAATPPPPARDLKPPAAPGRIPRDPIVGQGSAPVPLSTAALLTWLAVPPGALVLFWFSLAWRRAKETDPLRPQREAHARLRALLAEIRAAGQAPVATAQLLAWQRDTAVVWQLRHAAPTADALDRAGATEWAKLWREADRALYGAKAALPTDWLARAEEALVAKRVPGFRPHRLFLPQNLLAFAASLAVLLMVCAPVALVAAETAPPVGRSPEVAYRAGDFATAEKGWREAVLQRPTDWIARHNLSLALAQLDRPGEALAQATAAFVQHPSEPAVRWNFAYTADKAGFAPAALLPFLKDGPQSSIATRLSAAAWQRLLIAAAFVLAGALGLLLWNAYRSRRVAITRLAFALAAAATLTGFVAIFGIVAFGDTIDRTAAVVFHGGTLRSIPTEADTTQKTTALIPGSVGHIDQQFLGWNRLVFANGQTGWVRHEEFVPLWRR